MLIFLLHLPSYLSHLSCWLNAFSPINDTFNLNICYSCHSDCTMKYDKHCEHSLCSYTITEIHNLMYYSNVWDTVVYCMAWYILISLLFTKWYNVTKTVQG
jgi:hypothetical protein